MHQPTTLGACLTCVPSTCKETLKPFAEHATICAARVKTSSHLFDGKSGKVVVLKLSSDKSCRNVMRAGAGAVCGDADFIRALVDLQVGPVMLMGPTMDAKVASELSLRLAHLGIRMAEHSSRAAAYAHRLHQVLPPLICRITHAECLSSSACTSSAHARAGPLLLPQAAVSSSVAQCLACTIRGFPKSGVSARHACKPWALCSRPGSAMHECAADCFPAPRASLTLWQQAGDHGMTCLVQS